MHEDLKRHHGIKAGSARAFGFVFAGVFAFITFWPLLAGGSVRLWALALALALLVIAALRPALLAPLNRGWLRFGGLLHAVVSPIVLAVLFCLAVVPTGLLMRLLGKDPLRMRFNRRATTYWIERDPPGPTSDSMRNQF